MSNHKTCASCKVSKDKSLFYKHKRNGIASKCKKCANKYSFQNKRTELGLIAKIYSSQKTNSKRRCHELPSYTKEELVSWMYESGYKRLYDAWVRSGYIKSNTPSCDRLDDFQSYSLDNLRLVTWRENASKNYSEIRSATGAGGKANCIAVNQYSMSGELISKHKSIRLASRATGIDNGSISRACEGVRLKSTGGFMWRKEGVEL